MKYQQFFTEFHKRNPRLKDQVFLLDMPFYYQPDKIAESFSEILIDPAYRATNIFSIGKPEDKNTIPKDQIDDARKFIQDTPYQGNTQVLIINDADWMAEDQQNMLLKTLEEPPKHSLIFLVSPYRRLLGTIQSRSHVVEWFDFTQDKSVEELIQEFLKTSQSHTQWHQIFQTQFPTNFIEAIKIVEQITKDQAERQALEALFLWSISTKQTPIIREEIEKTMHTVFFTTAKNQTALESLFLKFL